MRRVVQYTRTVTVRISHVSIRTDRTDRQQVYTFCKVCFTVRKSHFIRGTKYVSWQELFYTVCPSVRIERIDNRGIRSVKSVLRSVNRISLVFIEQGKLHLECAFLGFCACVGLWFIERRILHLECAFLGFCACVGLWFIERGILPVSYTHLTLPTKRIV